MKQDAARLEFQWPLPRTTQKAQVGRPTRQMQWDEALLPAIRGSGVPPDIPRNVPHWWSKGEPMATIMEHMPVDDSESDQEQPCSATRRKRCHVASLEGVLGVKGL